MNETLDPQIVNLAKAIRDTESGGDYAARGGSGEFGAYQYTKPTWEADSQKYLGRVVPLEQADKLIQNEVAYKKFKDLKEQGYNVGQIASIHNSGKPDNYNNPNAKGVNKYGVSYDVPAYAKKVADKYQEYKGGGAVPVAQNDGSGLGQFSQPMQHQELAKEETSIPMTTQQPTGVIPEEGLLSKVGKGALGVFNAIQRPLVGLAATPWQLLAKGLGQEDPFAKGIPGLAGTTVPVTELNLKQKAGDALQFGGMVAPVARIPALIAAGVAQGAGSALSDDGDLAEVATGGLLGGAGAGILGGGAKLLGGALAKGGDIVSGQNITKTVQGIKKAYSEALNLHAGERGFESRTGKDLAQILMDNGLSLNKYDNGTLDATDALGALQEKLTPLNAKATEVLTKAEGVVADMNLKEVFDEVEKRIRANKITEIEKEQMIKQLKNTLNATAKRYGLNVDLPTSDLIKQGFWGTTFKRNITSNDALKSNVDYLIGNTIKDLEEKAVAGSDFGDVLKELNKERSNLVDAIKRLSKLDGVRTVRGGRLGNMFGGLTGTIAGSTVGGPVGALAGDYFGTKVASFLNNPANKIAIARGKAKATGIIPSLLGDAAEPVGQGVNKFGEMLGNANRPLGLLGSFLTNSK